MEKLGAMPRALGIIGGDGKLDAQAHRAVGRIHGLRKHLDVVVPGSLDRHRGRVVDIRYAGRRLAVRAGTGNQKQAGAKNRQGKAPSRQSDDRG